MVPRALTFIEKLYKKIFSTSFLYVVVEGWLCARRSQHRELYVILAEHLSALQASEALEALCSEFFASVLC